MNSPPGIIARAAALPGPVRGVLWVVLATALFALVPISVRDLSDTMSSSEIVFFRSAIGVAIMTAYFWSRGFGRLRTTKPGLHIWRAVLNFIGMVMWFYALGRMPIADAVAIHFTLPLFVVVLAAVFLGERPELRRSLATVVGFLGVLVILRPGFVEVSLAAMGVLASAALYAGTVILIKKVVRTDTAAVVNFYSNLIMLILSILPAAYDWTAPAWGDAPAIVLLGLSGAAAPYCVARALAAADATLVAPFDFLRLPFTAVMAYLFFAEAPPVWTWLGAAVIFASTYYIARREAGLAKERTNSDAEEG